MTPTTSLRIAQLPSPAGTLVRIEVLREQDERPFTFYLTAQQVAEIRVKGERLGTGSEEFVVGG